MANIRTRDAQHRSYFNEFELETMRLVCLRLGKPLGAFSQTQIKDLLNLFYTSKRDDRDDIQKGVGQLVLARCMLGTLQRHEWAQLLREPAFAEAALEVVTGSKNSSSPEEREGIEGLVANIRKFVASGGLP